MLNILFYNIVEQFFKDTNSSVSYVMYKEKSFKTILKTFPNCIAYFRIVDP